MANKQVTLKRVIDTSGNTDTIHPTTHWDQIESKPSTFTPTSHTHTISDISDVTIFPLNIAIFGIWLASILTELFLDQPPKCICLALIEHCVLLGPFSSTLITPCWDDPIRRVLVEDARPQYHVLHLTLSHNGNFHIG